MKIYNSQEELDRDLNENDDFISYHDKIKINFDNCVFKNSVKIEGSTLYVKNDISIEHMIEAYNIEVGGNFKSFYTRCKNIKAEGNIISGRNIIVGDSIRSGIDIKTDGGIKANYIIAGRNLISHCSITGICLIRVGYGNGGNIETYDNIETAGCLEVYGNILYQSTCIAYKSFKCKSVKGRRKNSLHKCLDREIEFIKD
jgi:hypothetical protein